MDTESTPDTLVVGETLVDMHPDGPGSLADVETFHRRPGGAPANVAVGLARLGSPPALWTRVGEDGLGDFLAETLRAEGIPDDLLQRDPTAPTGLAMVSLDADADRGFVLYLDGTASTRLQPGAVSDGRLAATAWLHVGGVELAHDPARQAVLDLLDRVPAETTVSFDPNARPQLWTTYDYAETLQRVLPSVDVLVASVEDLEPAGFPSDPVAVAREILADADGEDGSHVASDERGGPHTVLVTRGSAGALARATAAAPWGPATTAHGGFTVEPVDTTGAGDAFTAGAITALGEGQSLSAAVTFANAVAAESTTARGAMAALPRRTAVTSLLAE
jgi:fructokinase